MVERKMEILKTAIPRCTVPAHQNQHWILRVLTVTLKLFAIQGQSGWH